VLLNSEDPEILKGAIQAAATIDNNLMKQYVFESMRFDPPASGITRIALPGAPAPFTSGQIVLLLLRDRSGIFNAGAFLDAQVFPEPNRFRIDRNISLYGDVMFGRGPHACFARFINPVVITQIVQSLLQLKDLAPADYYRGQLYSYETDKFTGYQKLSAFPTHMLTRFSAFPDNIGTLEQGKNIWKDTKNVLY